MHMETKNVPDYCRRECKGGCVIAVFVSKSYLYVVHNLPSFILSNRLVCLVFSTVV